MGLFGSKKKKESNTGSLVNSNNISSATIITQGSKFIGNLIGNDTVHVDGEIEGDVSVNNVVVIGQSGKIKGNIKAQQVICNGDIDGIIECKNFELLQGAKAKHKLLASVVILNGEYNGEIIASRILVDNTGKVSNALQAKEIVIKGSFEGDLSCELLTTKATGKIKGNMYVKNILNEGGIVEGSIGQFKDLFTKEIEKKDDEVIEDVEVEEKDSKKDKK